MASSNNEKPHYQDNLYQQQQQPSSTTPPVQPDHSGLQVVESGLEVAGSDQSEALSAGSSPYQTSNYPIPAAGYHDPSKTSSPLRYVEQKGYNEWNGAPPPQVVPIEHQGSGFAGGGGGNRLYSASTGTSAQQHQYLGGHNPYDPDAGKPAKKPKICGLKRIVFWGLLGAAIFVVVLAVAVGVGVGVAVRNNSDRYARHLLVFFFLSCFGRSRAVVTFQSSCVAARRGAFLIHGSRPEATTFLDEILEAHMIVFEFFFQLFPCLTMANVISSSSSSGGGGNATASSTASSTATTTIPAATATATATSNTTIQCPSANRTLYELDTQGNTNFLVLCGRDYNSGDGAIDIAQVNTTFQGCLSECGETTGCVAVGWGNYYGTDTCWLKSQIGSPNWSADWYSGILDDSS